RNPSSVADFAWPMQSIGVLEDGGRRPPMATFSHKGRRERRGCVGCRTMSETVPVDMLKPVEDRGGAAQPLLQVNGLTKHFPVRGGLFARRRTVRAVDDVSFSIAKGETVGIVGESGCGKSTTARLLMHLMKRDTGDIIYDGMQVGRALSLRELRRGMQMVFQDSYASLNPRLTIEESIAFGPKVHGMADSTARTLARELLG